MRAASTSRTTAARRWQSLNTNMPTVPVPSLTFQSRDNSLVVGTYGRGIYILDDVGPLERSPRQRSKRAAVLASVTRGRQWNLSSLGPTYGAGEFYAPNPEFDPTISYHLRDAASGQATIAISDAGGQVVRTLRGPAQRGLNRVTWDMYMESATASPAADAASWREVEAVAAAVEVAAADEVVDVAAPVANAVRWCCRASTRSSSLFPESRNRCVEASPSKPIRWTRRLPSRNAAIGKRCCSRSTRCSERSPMRDARREH